MIAHPSMALNNITLSNNIVHLDFTKSTKLIQAMMQHLALLMYFFWFLLTTKYMIVDIYLAKWHIKASLKKFYIYNKILNDVTSFVFME